MRIVHDVCVPGYGVISNVWFSATAIAWLDSRLAIRNAQNYAGFAADVAETIYSGEIPPVSFETLGAGQMIESKQENIDGLLKILARYDTLKSVTLTAPIPPPGFDLAKKPLLRQMYEYCNQWQWVPLEVSLGVYWIGPEDHDTVQMGETATVGR